MVRPRTIKQAVILAGGEGRRLNPYSKILPKPLWPVGEMPIVEILIRQLSKAGLKEIIMAVGHQADLIRMVIGDGTQYGVKLIYSEEKKPLGTAAPLRMIRRLDNNFLVLNGDLLTNLPFRDFARQHLKNNEIATVAVYNRTVDVDFGVIEEENGQIEDYREKPVLKYLVSMGIYAFKKQVLEFIPNRKFDFPELVNKLIKNGLNPATYHFKGSWLDIGRPDDWEKADSLFRKRKKTFLK